MPKYLIEKEHKKISYIGVTKDNIFGILLMLHAPLQYIIMFAITLWVSFGLTMILGIKEDKFINLDWNITWCHLLVG